MPNEMDESSVDAGLSQSEGVQVLAGKRQGRDQEEEKD